MIQFPSYFRRVSGACCIARKGAFDPRGRDQSSDENIVVSISFSPKPYFLLKGDYILNPNKGKSASV